MKRLCIGWICALWSIGAVCANDNDRIPIEKKPDPTKAIAIPWDQLNESAATIAKQMLDRPTVQARGPVDTFTCTPEQYYWLLDNPDRAVTAWRRLGAKCVSIEKRGPGRFGYVDELGTNVAWETIYEGNGVRMWLATGKVKASTVLPLVPIKALVVLRHSEGKNVEGVTVVQHQTEVIVHIDSKAANAVAKMMNQSTMKAAEHGLSQLQLFFSALSSYVDRHPEKAETLFRVEK